MEDEKQALAVALRFAGSEAIDEAEKLRGEQRAFSRGGAECRLRQAIVVDQFIDDLRGIHVRLSVGTNQRVASRIPKYRRTTAGDQRVAAVEDAKRALVHRTSAAQEM